MAVIEGAAGSGKTTTLRPIADLCREHGGTVIATAVAWRTAVALGNDLDARPFCVDKLLKLAAKNGIEIDDRTTIVVDEAGMLSTRQAHHVLRLAERHGARVVFAGDTRQQQPVEAGPGLRLIRDAVGSVRVDRIRRQRPDFEDILVHVHGETPAAARFRGGLMGDDERARIFADYGAMAQKPAFTPWQVNVSEALRDGDAAAAIQAWHERGRLHLGYNEERTLTALVDNWDRYTQQHPEKSAVVLARTRAEVRALSHLMREKRFARYGAGEQVDVKRVTVMVSRGTEDDRTVSPLEIAVGDRLRIGATCWEKQLFNGTVVTVEDLEVLPRAAGTGTEGRAAGEARDRPAGDPPVEITARTDDGRRMTFRHDEIRDWYGNVRLDHGYALTIAAAQGLTVDKTFLLADDRPARETIYPAATRHREEIDVYVNRAPLTLDVTDRRADSDREAPVMDGEIRAYLAERWSRARPKEAALDYLGDGEWEDLAENVRRRRSAGERTDMDDVRAAANDNAMARIAHDIHRTVLAWRHGAAVDAFAAGRQEVLASWDGLRERSRAEGDVVALSPAYRETLDRHAALLRQAEPFRARPEAFAPLLAERARIGRGDLDEFQALHERARRHRRSAVMRETHRTRREAEGQASPAETQRDVRPAHGKAVEAASLAPPDWFASVPPPTEDDLAEIRAEAAWDALEDLAPQAPEPPKPDWRSAWEPVIREWNALIGRARQSGAIAFYTKGYAGLIPRIRELAENPDVPDDKRESLEPILKSDEHHRATRKRIEDFLDTTERHMEKREALGEAAMDANKIIAELPNYRRWRGKAERLVAEGEAILSDRKTYGPHLDNITVGAERAQGAVSDLGEAIQEDEKALAQAKREAGEQRRWVQAQSRLMFATDPAPDAAEVDTAREAPVRAALSRLGHVAGLALGGEAYRRQIEIEGYERAALERTKQPMLEWNRLVERAMAEGVHVIHTEGYDRLRKELDAVSRNFDLDRRIAAKIEAVLSKLGEARTDAGYVESRHGFLLSSLERREELHASAARRSAAVAGLAEYDSWRHGIDEALEHAEHILANPGRYGVHLRSVARGRESLSSALARVREMLREDDRHLAAVLAGRRKGEAVQEREERVARLLDDPDELRRLRELRAQRRRAGRRQRKGRYQSRGISM